MNIPFCHPSPRGPGEKDLVRKKNPGNNMLIGFLVLGIFMSCRPVKHPLYDDAATQLIFGSGGGFSGGTTSYILLENGRLYKQNSLTKDTLSLTKLNRKKTRDLFQKLVALHIQQLDFNHPGNLYYFIENKQEKEEHRVVWGNTEHPPPAEVQNFYRTLQSIIPQDSP